MLARLRLRLVRHQPRRKSLPPNQRKPPPQCLSRRPPSRLRKRPQMSRATSRRSRLPVALTAFLAYLLYKSFIEVSSDRADFLSRLFARKRPAGLDADSSVDRLFEAYVGLYPATAPLLRPLAGTSA